MDLRKYLIKNYQTAGPFEGVNYIENRLLKNHYLVVIDNDNKYYGILSATDIIERPHKLVIDCITKKESLYLSDSYSIIISKFYSSNSAALPVMKESDFLGVIEKNQIIKELENSINDLYNKSLISQKAKKYFLNNLSHEIRTPLNGILGFLEIINQINEDEFINKGENAAEIVKKSAGKFLQTMNDLIELSLINAGDNVRIDKANVDIVKLLSDLKDHFTGLPSIHNKSTTIVYSTSESSFCINTDEKKLRHILYHLIDNAIKFSGNNKVTYGFKYIPNKKYVNFYVINEESQISENYKKTMFMFFEKQENIGDELNPGLGIGLPLVKNLTHLLGGNIRLESKSNEIAFSLNIPIK